MPNQPVRLYQGERAKDKYVNLNNTDMRVQQRYKYEYVSLNDVDKRVQQRYKY